MDFIKHEDISDDPTGCSDVKIEKPADITFKQEYKMIIEDSSDDKKLMNFESVFIPEQTSLSELTGIKEEVQDNVEDILMKQEVEDISIKEEVEDEVRIAENESQHYLLGFPDKNASKSTLQSLPEQHLPTYSEKEPFTGDKAFVKKSALSAHQLKHNNHKAEKPQCPICEGTFLNKQHLRRHSIIHTGERPHKCDLCDKAYKQKKDLIVHLATHSGEKPHKCDICNKTFSAKQNLSLHVLIHSGIKRYTCDVCNKGFTQKSQLSRHSRVHTGERPFKCDVCSKKFRSKQTLSLHSFVHAGEKPLVCDICNKTFVTKSHLSKHMIVCSGEKTHVCKICNQGFSLYYHLRRHTLTHPVDSDK